MSEEPLIKSDRGERIVYAVLGLFILVELALILAVRKAIHV